MSAAGDTSHHPIRTGEVADFRALRFGSAAELHAEIDRLVAADRAGRLRRSGNWTLGQILGHLAVWIDYGYDPPPQLRPPFYIRWLTRLAKRKYLRGPLPRGFKIPRVPGGTLGIAPAPLEEGLSRFRKSWNRLETAPPERPNLLFGPLTPNEWIALHLRHAELHFGYVHPE